MPDNRLLYDLVRMNSAEAVLDEVLTILNMIMTGFKTEPVIKAFNKTVSLYNGNFPGYRSCNTEYHDLQHVTDTFLAMARLIHGASLQGSLLSERHISIGLIAVLLHDTGYIQKDSDTEGTGAKHTAMHVQRSMDFLRLNALEFKLSDEEITDGRAMILCTDLAEDIEAIAFSSPEAALLGKILATADMIAQMADRAYLEKTLFLYREFKEGRVEGYKTPADLLQKTLDFYNLIDCRFREKLDGIDRLMMPHFVSRWNINKNLYIVAISNQKNYLKHILALPGSNPFIYLRRNGIVNSSKQQ